MRKRRRKWDDLEDEDPGAGLVNLFDVWIAFAAALLLAMISYLGASARGAASGKKPTPHSALESLEKARVQMDRFQQSRQTAGGEGERLGTAYRLKSGEVIYVPDSPSMK
jgi:hypothetical protein